jgi:hypothetical protein
MFKADSVLLQSHLVTPSAGNRKPEKTKDRWNQKMGQRTTRSLEQRMVSKAVALATERMRKQIEKIPKRNLKKPFGFWV